MKALTRRHRDAPTSRFSDDTDRQIHLRALARAFASESASERGDAPSTARRPPERATSFKPFVVPGPDSGPVSRATVVSTASRGMARRAERPKALERESPRGAQPKTRLMLASRPDARNGDRAVRIGHCMPRMVGRERRGGLVSEANETSVSKAHRKAAAASGAGR